MSNPYGTDSSRSPKPNKKNTKTLSWQWASGPKSMQASISALVRDFHHYQMTVHSITWAGVTGKAICRPLDLDTHAVWRCFSAQAQIARRGYISVTSPAGTGCLFLFGRLSLTEQNGTAAQYQLGCGSHSVPASHGEMFADTTCWFLTYPTAAWQRSTTVHKADGGEKKDRQTDKGWGRKGSGEE